MSRNTIKVAVWRKRAKNVSKSNAWILNVDMTLSLTVSILSSYLTYQRATISSIIGHMKCTFHWYQNDIQYPITSSKNYSNKRKTQYSPFNETHLLITYKPNKITNGTTSAIFNLKHIMSNMLYVICLYVWSPFATYSLTLCTYEMTKYHLIQWKNKWHSVLLFTKIHQMKHSYRG